MSEKLTEYQHKDVDAIIKGLDHGEYVIPTFQRDYEWETTRIVNFLNSMINKEPFGYIVIWGYNNRSELCESRNYILNNYKQHKMSSRTEIEYLIDGQQRITTCFILKKWKNICEDFGKWNKSKKSDEFKQLNDLHKKFKDIYFNLDNMNFEIIKKSDKKTNHIELLLLSKYDKFRNMKKEPEVIEMISNYGEDILETKIEDTIDSFKSIFNMTMGCVNLRRYDLHEVIEIFQNMNTKGKSLTIFDLLHSKWYEKNINLTNEFNKLVGDLSAEWQGLSKDVFIDALYLVLNKDKPIINNKEKLAFDLSQIIVGGDNSILQKYINNTIKSIKQATYFLSQNKFNSSNIPSEIIVKWLSYFFDKSTKTISSKNKAFILYYISIISINRRYSSSTTSKLEKDINILNSLLSDNIGVVIKLIEDDNDILSIDKGSVIMEEKYSSPSMKSKFLCWWMMNQSIDPYSNIEVKDIDFKGVDLHHIFPKKLKDKSIFKDKYNPDSIVNILPITKETNNMIGNNKPSDYIKSMSNNFKEIIENVGILIEHLRNDDFEAMIEHRQDWLRDKVNAYIEKQKKEFLSS